MANVTSGFLENTGWQVVSGSWQVEDSDNGKKQITCKGAGVLKIPYDSFYGNKAYSIKKAGAVSAGLYSSDNEYAAAWNGYGIIFGATNQYIAKVTAAAGAILDTGPTSISQGTWYDFKMTRTPASVFAGYLNGVSETAVTDSAFTTGSKYIFFISNNIGDAVREIRYSPVIT